MRRRSLAVTELIIGNWLGVSTVLAANTPCPPGRYVVSGTPLFGSGTDYTD